MADASRPRPDLRRQAPSRGDAPMWRQATEGIGLVVVLSGVVAVAGLLLAFLVSLLF